MNMQRWNRDWNEVNLAYKGQIEQWIAANRSVASSRELTQLYETSVTAKTAADFWGDNVAAVPLIPHKNGEPLSQDIDHPLVRMCYSPRMNDLMRRVVITDLFWGRVLLQKERNLYDQPGSLRWVNPSLYSLDATSQDGLRGFHVYPSRYATVRAGYLPRHEAVYLHSFDFEDDFDGISAAEVAYLQAATQPEVAQTVLSFFRNMAIPAGLVMPTTDEPSEEHAKDRKPLINFLRRTVQGARNVGRTIVLSTRWEWQQMQMAFKDLVMKEINEDVRQQVCEAFAVNVEFFTTGQTNYAELEGKIELWRTMRLKPRLLWYAQRISVELADDYPGYSIVPDFTSILRDDADQRMELVEKKIDKIIITLADAQKEMGMEPDMALDGLYMIEGVPVHRDDLKDYWKIKSGAGLMLPAPPTEEKAAPPTESKGDPLTVTLDFGGDADLMSLQQRLKEQYPDAQWRAPDDLHLTLLTTPGASSSQTTRLIEALRSQAFDAPLLTIGSLRAFDTLGKHALHFRIRRNANLLALHEQVYQLASDLGIAAGTYAAPDAFLPHITVGHTPTKPKTITYQGSTRVEPTGLIVTHGGEIIATIPFKAGEEYLADKTFAEIKVAARKAYKSQPFTRDTLDEYTHLYIQSLAQLGIDQDAIVIAAKSIFLRIRAAKAIQATRLDFELAFEDVLAAARDANLTKARFKSILNNEIERFARLAFADGLIDGGIADGTLDAKDETDVFQHTRAQREYVSSFAETLFKSEGGISDKLATLKPAQWWNKSVEPMYYAGLQSAAGNAYFMWALGQTEKHCNTCKALDGQVHRMRDYQRSGWLPKASKLECGGHNCDCRLNPAPGQRAKGRFPKAVAA